MKCRTFDRDCADWLRDRLSGPEADAMAAHEASCAHCAAIAAEERRILAIMARRTCPAPSADLWPKLAQRLQELGAEPQAPKTTPLFHRPRLWSGAFGHARWALLGAAVALLAFVISRPTPQQQLALVPAEDERRVVEMIAATQPVRYVEAATDDFVVGGQFDTQRWLLVGNGE